MRTRTRAARALAIFAAGILGGMLFGAPATAQDFPPFDKVTDGFELNKGFFHVFKKKEKMYLAVPADRVNQQFLFAISIAGGPNFAGFMWDDYPVRLERLENKLLLVRPNVRHKAKSGDPLADVVERTFTDSVLLSLPIVTMAPDGSLLVDADDLFKTDLGEVGNVARRLGGGGSLDGSVSQWSKWKTFPDNTEIGLDAVFRGGSGWNASSAVTDARGIRIRIHYSISRLPSTGYQPRPADNRVGYFLTAVKDFSQAHDADTMFQRYVNRWHLEKVDPKLELSPPKKPIVFYIEKTVPYRFRRWVKEGILEWNKAFEKIGFVGAIEVRQQTDDNEFADYDPEDVRYNFFRWVTTGSAFAMGPSRTHPATGQILDADIIFDDSYVRLNAAQNELFGRDSAARFLFDPTLEQFMEAHPVHDPWGRWLDRPGTENAPASADVIIREMLAEKSGQYHCECATGRVQQMRLARVWGQVQAAKGTGFPEEFVGHMLKDTVMHEVGHTLGLRHNFKASSVLKIDEINSEGRPAAIAGSVMDYNPVNFVPKGMTQGNWTPTTIGPYDYWAIEYGYAVPADGNQEKLLAEIASRSAQPELTYATDEDTSFLGPDPLVNRWDLGSDPMDFARLRFTLVRELLAQLPDKVVDDGEGYQDAREAVDTLLYDYAFSAALVGRYVGGQYVHRDVKGTPNARPPFVVVPAKKQQQAMAMLNEEIFGREALSLSPELVNSLAPGRFWHWDSDELTTSLEYPVHQRLLMIKSWSLSLVLNPVVITRLHNAELQVPADQEIYSLPEHLAGVQRAIWAEVYQPAKPPKDRAAARKGFIPSDRRNLQREHLGILINMALGPVQSSWYPADATTLAFAQLRDLEEVIAKVDVSQLDAYSRAHLQETLERIGSALDVHTTR